MTEHLKSYVDGSKLITFGFLDSYRQRPLVQRHKQTATHEDMLSLPVEFATELEFDIFLVLDGLEVRFVMGPV